jgi:cytochrome P450
MICNLAGAPEAAFPTDKLTAGIEATMASAEHAQRGSALTTAARADRERLVKLLVEWVEEHSTVFADILHSKGWTGYEIAAELVGLAVAAWESTAAAVTSAVTLGIGTTPTDTEIDELLRLYPPSWLIARELSGDEPWGQAGELAVVSPWLLHRNETAWQHPGEFDPTRFAGHTGAEAYMPFGSGPRRCPAGRYANTQIAVALGLFGGQQARMGKPVLLARRAAALVACDSDRT